MDARAPAMAQAIGLPGSSAALAERLLNVVLFVTILLSCIAFVEPSPHDVMMLVLLATCIMARVPLDRRLTPLLGLTVVWLIGGAMSLIQVADTEQLHPILHQDAVVYFATSVYLGVAAILFACLFGNGDATRLLILRRASILSAVIATATGYMGFFHLVPGAAALFLEYSRVSGTFKDPNVYGPFLVFPILMLTVGFLTQRVTLVGLLTAAFLAGGLFLSFSRGAWVHLTLSGAIALALCYLTAPNTRMRGRIVAFGLLTILAIAVALIALLSISSVHDMFVERAKVLQPYDSAGSGGRFALQEIALGAILDHPNGMGPYGFSNAVIGGQQHNVYLQVFLVYGWLGGATYVAIVFLTFMIGLRYAFSRTPWQPYLIAAYAAYVGEIGEGVIIDTDHWRHYFLVLGLVWGLSVATINYRRAQVHAGAHAAAIY
jgi:O-antigen ligase